MQIVYIGQKGDPLSDVPARDPNIDMVLGVSAGKFRRYHGEGIRQFLDIKTGYLNIRDAFRVIAGIFQSWRILRRVKPDMIFVKGGFVGVPVGLAAAKLHIPFITHDSDRIPGLANRIIGRWASKHAVAMPEELYSYPRNKTVTVGVPVVTDYTYVTATLQAQYRQQLGIPENAKVVFIIGGGQGARRINDALVSVMPKLVHQFKDLYVIHGAGRANEAEVSAAYETRLSTEEKKRITVAGYLHDVYRYSGASDVIITRAGATNLAEFAIQGKACIVVPAPFLTGGHQLKNAAYLQEQHATEQIVETDLEANPELLGRMVTDLLNNPAKRLELGKTFAKFGHPDSAKELADLLLAEMKLRSS
ncbi:undecaprenyldiphospho-muramoylpentapeptide beta-N-acetylglucosaminyltransferase [soil metagenome]